MNKTSGSVIRKAYHIAVFFRDPNKVYSDFWYECTRIDIYTDLFNLKKWGAGRFFFVLTIFQKMANNPFDIFMDLLGYHHILALIIVN